MVMDLTKRNTDATPARAGFRIGFSDVFRRVFSLDFSGGDFGTPAHDGRSGPERDEHPELTTETQT